ncbi:hypothetical protein GCM10011487_66530 [Steroidobacter agaridevorans]|uniref:Uncharacterized protein n=1 Tax=Steroidobacter agaridevorans TaxID=2695856 RepID=A0A829YPB3_9GAMM|nr:hypothetical protein [Steroidobacter agaridevorans]GFE84653.1 hypothetical protein GCM10011487_66530 [Steroidobacter agaridevorans]
MEKSEQAVPKTIRTLALLIALLPVPSTLWRLLHIFGFNLGLLGPPLLERSGGPSFAHGVLYLLFLCTFTCGAAYLAIGLVARWGEVFPSWVPVLRGRKVPRTPAFLIAVSGAIAVISITGPIVSNVLQVVIDPTHAVLGRFSSWPWRWLFVACYAPLALWGPLLLIVAVHYYRRRGLE